MTKPLGCHNRSRYPGESLQGPSAARLLRGFFFHWLGAPPKRICELGCGSGSLSALLAERGYEVVAFDVDPRVLAVASESHSQTPRLTFRLWSDDCEPLLRGFDAIVSLHSAHHLSPHILATLSRHHLVLVDLVRPKYSGHLAAEAALAAISCVASLTRPSDWRRLRLPWTVSLKLLLWRLAWIFSVQGARHIREDQLRGLPFDVEGLKSTLETTDPVISVAIAGHLFYVSGAAGGGIDAAMA